MERKSAPVRGTALNNSTRSAPTKYVYLNRLLLGRKPPEEYFLLGAGKRSIHPAVIAR